MGKDKERRGKEKRKGGIRREERRGKGENSNEISKKGVVAHAYNPGRRKTKAGRLLRI